MPSKSDASKHKKRSSSKSPIAIGAAAKSKLLAKKGRLAAEKARALARRVAAAKRAADEVHKAADSVHVKVQAIVTESRESVQAAALSSGGKKVPPAQALPVVKEGQKRRTKGPDEGGKAREMPAKKAPGAAFPIVGIGASAGGFEASQALLKSLPADTGMAFVLIQHLDPTHESQLSELLTPATTMEVRQVRRSTKVEPNHVYVIPPNQDLVIEDGNLKLTSPRRTNGRRLSVDSFFQSLARDQGNRAIGVVLSGTGTDGTLGLEAIKAEGGVTFAQDEISSKFSGMPSSAWNAGVVDFVLPPEEIARELVRVARHPSLALAKAIEDEPHRGEEEEELSHIFKLLHGATQVDFLHYKRSTLQRRILRRMVLNRMEDLASYVACLEKDPSEVEALFQDLLINVTSFFRDPGVFKALKNHIFPQILKHKHGLEPIRVWVPGCSTGEEAYSLAICLHEFLAKRPGKRALQVFATDVSERVISKARAGRYPKGIASHISPERFRRYFRPVDDGYQIVKFIRDSCVFAQQNVVVDPPFSKLDFISCRNVLIYFGPGLQKKVIPIFHYGLNPHGYLLLGASETIGGYPDLFTLVDKKNKIYVKHPGQTRLEHQFIPKIPQTTARLSESRQPEDDVPLLTIQREVDQILLSSYAPSGIVINSKMEILHFRGQTGVYLEHAPGEASLHLLKMVREGLMVDIRMLVAQAMKHNKITRREGIVFKADGRLKEVNIEVVPFRVPPSNEKLCLILFRENPQPERGSLKPSVLKKLLSGRNDGTGKMLQRLREENESTKESLQNIIEEQETTNEELKSANEEIQSSNEELQSTNEELETAKEELQSTNEELTTLNEELQNRNSELGRLNNDLNNIVASFNLPMLILGGDLTVRRFTTAAERLFNLIPGDIGRPISNINPQIHFPNMAWCVAEVIDTLNMQQHDVQDSEGHWYSLRIRPYRTSENKIDGAVLVLIDIDEIKTTFEEVVAVVRQPLLVLDGQFRVMQANRAFYEEFQLNPEDTEETIIFQLSGGKWDFPALRTLLEGLLPQRREVERYEIEHDFPKVGRRKLMVSARRIVQHSKGTTWILIAIDDLTSKSVQAGVSPDSPPKAV